MPALVGDALEIDELVVRVKPKRRYRYLWVAVSRVTRQVVGWCLGSRGAKTLETLWFSLPGPYRRKLVYHDPYEAYGALCSMKPICTVACGSSSRSTTRSAASASSD